MNFTIYYTLPIQITQLEIIGVRVHCGINLCIRCTLLIGRFVSSRFISFCYCSGEDDMYRKSTTGDKNKNKNTKSKSKSKVGTQASTTVELTLRLR